MRAGIIRGVDVGILVHSQPFNCLGSLSLTSEGDGYLAKLHGVRQAFSAPAKRPLSVARSAGIRRLPAIQGLRL
jgi:hypothetical protein